MEVAFIKKLEDNKNARQQTLNLCSIVRAVETWSKIYDRKEFCFQKQHESKTNKFEILLLKTQKNREKKVDKPGWYDLNQHFLTLCTAFYQSTSKEKTFEVSFAW